MSPLALQTCALPLFCTERLHSFCIRNCLLETSNRNPEFVKETRELKAKIVRKGIILKICNNPEFHYFLWIILAVSTAMLLCYCVVVMLSLCYVVVLIIWCCCYHFVRRFLHVIHVLL